MRRTVPRRRYLRAQHLAVGWVALLSLAAAGNAIAGPVLVAGTFEGGRYAPAEAPGEPCAAETYSSTRVQVDGDEIRVRSQHTFRPVADKQTEAAALIPLPTGVRPGSVVVRVDEQAVKARFLDVAATRAALRAMAKAARLPALVALAGNPAVLLDRLDLTSERQLQIEFTATASTQQGTHSFSLPRPAAAFGAAPVERSEIQLTLEVDQPLRTVFSPSHDLKLERPGPRKATARHSARDVPGSDDLHLFWVADEDPLGLRVLTHRAADEDFGTFLVLATPTGTADADSLPKDLVLVLDTSGSMRGEKMEQARASIDYCLEHLGAQDRFNLITFGTEIRPFRPTVVAASQDNVVAAREYADEVVASGRTNISGALAAGLAGQADPGRMRMVIFLTDGTPTAGEMNPERIVERIPTLNTSRARIFALGVGHDVNAHLLDRLAMLTDGSSEYLDPEGEIDVKVAGLYDRLSHPVLTDVRLAFGRLQTSDVDPERLPALFKGTEVLVLGRYKGGGEHTVTLSGRSGAAVRSFERKVVFPSQGTKSNAFLATLWATRRIGNLLRRIRLEGARPELITEVVRLSRRYGVVTEYTAFLSSGDDELTPEQAATEATRRMQEANVRKSGAWAVRQAGNEAALRGRKVASGKANVFVDRSGRRRAAKKVRHVGGRAFYLRGERWVEASAASPAAAPPPTRQVKLFSDEYFELAEQDADFAQAQSLGGNVTLDVGAERIQLVE